jgi:hypothetical protein
MTRLIPKREIDSLKQQERERTVKEGADIAVKVDALRLMYAKEEKNLRDFREHAMADVHMELDALAHQRLDLLADIEAKQRERDRLLEPLDAEWRKIEQQKDALAIARDTLKDEELTGIKWLDEIKEREDGLIRQEIALQTRLQEADRLYGIAARNEAVATDLRKNAEAEAKGMMLAIRERDDDSRTLEREVKTREMEARVREEQVSQREVELTIKEKRNEDLYQMLLRNQSRNDQRKTG